MLRDHRTAPWSDKDKALFDYVEAANNARGLIDRRVVERARALGWSDGALYDAATAVALFNFYNRWIDAGGVHAMSDEAHRAGGKRMASQGYA